MTHSILSVNKKNKKVAKPSIGEFFLKKSVNIHRLCHFFPQNILRIGLVVSVQLRNFLKMTGGLKLLKITVNIHKVTSVKLW